MLNLGGCGKSPEPQLPVQAAPAVSSAPAVVTAPVPSPAPASAPPITTAPATATVAAAAQATDTGPERAGDVVLAEGSVTDTGVDGKSRQLQDGDTVYPGDSFVIGDASYLDMDFEDGGRILLRPDTTFQIQEYHFDPDSHPTEGGDGQPLIKPQSQQPESSFFKLVKGGLRAVDGLIGHTEPKNYGIETPVATIGVRGTSFDVRYCGDDCKDEQAANGKTENGLYTAVSDGSIGVKNESGETVTPAGHYGYVASRHAALRPLVSAPRALRNMALPAKLKARDDTMRTKVQTRRQQRHQLQLQRRRQQAGQKKLLPAAGAKRGRVTPAERREERRQERAARRSEERQPAAQERNRKRNGSTQAAPAKPDARVNPAPEGGRRQKREQLRERREERAAERQSAGAGQKQQPGKAQSEKAQLEKSQPEKTRCKGKRKKGKDKDKCGGD